jgi:hypothetical protein
VCVCVMCGVCVCVCVMCGVCVCNVWCVCVFVMCGCFGNMYTILRGFSYID